LVDRIKRNSGGSPMRLKQAGGTCATKLDCKTASTKAGADAAEEENDRPDRPHGSRRLGAFLLTGPDRAFGLVTSRNLEPSIGVPVAVIDRRQPESAELLLYD
jgi:hypothetical protein